jgi:hypothetical protein
LLDAGFRRRDKHNDWDGRGAAEDPMAIYTVHEPPLKRDETEPNPDRFVFVRDGFYFWAFLLTPLWMLRHRLWLVLLCYALVTAALGIILRTAGASGTVSAVVGLLVAILAGCEGATLRRFTLARRGYKTVGLVVGDDRDSAERRFFEGWNGGGHAQSSILPPGTPGVPAASSPAPALTAAAALRRPPGNEVLGLFPQPGAPR